MSFDVYAIESALLAGQWDDQIIPGHLAVSQVLARNVVEGEFSKLLTSSYAKEVFSVKSSITQENTHLPLEEWFDLSVNSLSDETEVELTRLALAVACLHAFVQVNWTGPDLDLNPSAVLHTSAPDSLSEEFLNQKSVAELAYGGEPAYHLVRFATFLRIAQLLLALPYRHCQSIHLWNLRCATIHQHILDEPVGLPAAVFTTLQPLSATLTISSPDLAGRLFLEQGLLEHHFGHDKSAVEFFIRAAKSTGLEYELTGALGKRTKFQQTELSQLVLLAESRSREDKPPQSSTDTKGNPGTTEPESKSVASNVPETLALNDDTLLEQTEFTSSRPAKSGSVLSHLDPSAQPALHPLDQCILLSLCLNVKNTSPAHGLTSEQMSPYVARVISHPLNWSVHTMALLLRSRLESSRTRTVERSTLQLQALIDQMPTSDSTLAERLLYFHDIPLPSKWEMERELAMRFLSLGVVKSAMEIFERLEMWEEVVKCWQSMERPDKGIAIVRDLLEGRKAEADTVILRGKVSTEKRKDLMDSTREAKLWCLLGDLEPEHALDHYERAWTTSKETSGRAMRSLGGYYFARGKFAEAIPCLQKAVTINPLLSRTWFILGCACVRQEEWEDARVAFARCVAIDDEDGESWSNLASVYLRMGAAGKTLALQKGEREEDDNTVDELTLSSFTSGSIPHSNKILAFRALKQGLKFSYENWRMWMNYMIVAMDVGELSEACRAQARIVEERSAKLGAACVDEDVLERLVDAVTRAPTDPNEATTANGGVTVGNPSEGHGLLKRVLDLFERTILPRVSSTRIFRAYARLLTSQTRWSDALKAYLDAYRGGVAGTVAKGELTDVASWRAAVGEVEEIVDVLRNLGPRAEAEDGEGNAGARWESQGRSIVRTFMGRTKDFEDEPEWARLEALVEELRKTGE